MDYLTEKTDPISKKLISIPLETSLFHEFLERKHEKLKSELNQDQSLENLMQIHNQLNLLYPESELLLLTQQKIATLSQDESNPKRKYVLLFLLSISLMGSATLWWISQPEKTKLVSKAAITKPVTKATVETPKVVSKKVTPKKIVPVAPRVKYGFINFELPPGVKVYVDNILVPERSLHKYKLKAGKHKVRFEKEGFDPINGSVDVKANNTSIVRIGGA
tara:strand:- start:62 stop:721 length:660 start_codon:yes stop_codon:yes gene_type:complete